MFLYGKIHSITLIGLVHELILIYNYFLYIQKQKILAG